MRFTPLFRGLAISFVFLASTPSVEASFCEKLFQFFENWRDRSDERRLKGLSSRILSLHRAQVEQGLQSGLNQFQWRKAALRAAWMEVFTISSRHDGFLSIYAPHPKHSRILSAIIPASEIKKLLAESKKQGKEFRFRVSVSFQNSPDESPTLYEAEEFEILPASFVMSKGWVDAEVEQLILNYAALKRGMDAVRQRSSEPALLLGPQEMGGALKSLLDPHLRPLHERKPEYLLEEFRERLLCLSYSTDFMVSETGREALIRAFLETDENGVFLVVRELRELKEESEIHYREALQFLESHLRRNLSPHFHKDLNLMRASQTIAELLGETQLSPQALAKRNSRGM